MPGTRPAGEPFTVPVPRPLEVRGPSGEHWWAEVGGRELRLSNLDKVFWPGEGYTKGDLLAYYLNVAEYLLPYLRDRPLTMKRMPDGIAGPHFYEKNAPPHTPDWMPRCWVPSEDSPGQGNEFLMVDDPAGLLFVANLGCIEFHPLHSRCGSLDHPDYLFFDLDPSPPATFEDVLEVALLVREALARLGLACSPKTSGATGMQVYVGLAPGPRYEHARELVAAVGRLLTGIHPQKVTMDRDPGRRAGKVFVDHAMNRRGANIAAAYSVRPEPGAPVSTPLTWEEVEAGCHPRDFTIRTVHERLARVGDLFAPVLTQRADIRPALERLGLSADYELGPPAPAPERLREYERKRRFAVTAEPPPAVPERSPGNTFVIHKHRARRLHYDLRLEREGVLVSWAVPRGLPTRPGERRLAVRTEDHPLAYADFEGSIPEGQYGAGEVRIYDRGTYEALEWTDDKVTFRLHGRRHRGEYHLVRTAQGWLVFLSRRSAPQPPPPPPLAPMLAEPWDEPFDDPGWRFEPKLDGVRTLAYVATDATRLVSRTGRDQTAQYPELANLAQYVNARQAVLDGEIVALDEGGRPSFERLQQRMNLTSAADVQRARRTHPVTLYAFDLLWLDDRDLTAEPLEERRRLLEEVVTQGGPLRLTWFQDGEGRAFFEACRELGLEGCVAKRLGSPYLPGRRSRDWRKVKATRTLDAVVLGWTPGTGSRQGTFGALLLGAYRGGELRWVGQVGTGFTHQRLAELVEVLRGLETDRPPVADPELARVKGARWVRPELVCEVEYLEVTRAGKLRAPSFRRLRGDKRPQECVLPDAEGEDAAQP